MFYLLVIHVHVFCYSPPSNITLNGLINVRKLVYRKIYRAKSTKAIMIPYLKTAINLYNIKLNY